MNSRGYGGRLSPPCRQLPNAPREFVSRALMSRPGRNLFARSADGFLPFMLSGEDCRASMRASPQSDQHKPLNTLRCIINSAESAMGDTLKTALKTLHKPANTSNSRVFI